MNEKPIVIDCRTGTEYLISHIPDSILISYDEIRNKITNVVPDKNTKIALYCRSGERSGIANLILKQMGYTNSENYGGFTEAKERLNKEK